MPNKIIFAQILAILKKYGYHDSFKMEISRMGNAISIGSATRM